MVFPTKSEQVFSASSSNAVDAPRVTFSLYEKFGKRLFDLVFLALVSPIVIPVILILAVLVKLDGGPAFYAQRRIGRNGKTFQFYKLRSMRVNADAYLVQLCKEDPEIAKEWETYQKLRNDPRITKVGKFIRKTSLDELPQVLNVLKGDMSFVGPAPLCPANRCFMKRPRGGLFRHAPRHYGRVAGLWSW